MVLKTKKIIQNFWYLIALSFPLFAIPYLRGEESNIGFTITLPTILILCIPALYLIFNYKINKNEVAINFQYKNYLFLIIFLFILLHILSITKGFNFISTTKEIIKIIAAAIIFCIVYFFFPREESFFIKFMKIVLWCSSLLMIFLIYKYFFIFRSSHLGSALEYATRKQRNQLTGYFVYLFPYFISLIIAKKFTKINLLPFFVIILGLIYSGSRGTWIAITSALFFMLYQTKMFLNIKKVIKSGIFILSFIALAILTLQILSSELNMTLDFNSRFISIFVPHEVTEFDTYDARLFLAQKAVDSFFTSPLLGIGLSNFPFTNLSGKVTHNDYFTVLCELGIVGILFFFIILLFIFNRINYVSLKNKTENGINWFLLGSRGSFLSVLVFLCFMNIYSTVIFWFTLGLILVTTDIKFTN